MRPEKTVLCFCKYPDPGVVKSRLAKTLGKGCAAAVYKAMAEHIVRTVSAGDHALVLYCFPDIHHAFFKHCASKYNLPLYRQEGDHLGDRMFHAMDTHLRDGHPVILIGSDCPEVGIDYIDKAFHMLGAGNDIVLGPARDGGYALIGATRIDRSVFGDISWSTDQVLEQTLSKIKELRWKSACLPEVRDMDTFSDYRYFLEHENYKRLFAAVSHDFSPTC